MDPARDPRRGAGAPLKAPRTLTPTRAGWCFFALTLGVGFAALNTGNNLLYLVFSLMLAFLVLSGVLSESALRKIQVSRLLPREVYAGAANIVRLHVHNDQPRVSAFAIVIEDRVFNPDSETKDPATESAGRAFLLRIGPNEQAAARYTLTPESRGQLEFAPIRVSTRFPFGLFVKSRSLDLGGTALVYPELHSEPIPEPNSAEANDGETSALADAAGSNVVGLREFAPGDPMRRVHWKTSLKRQTLLVVEQEDERDVEVEIVLITQPVRGAGAADFEGRVSQAATEVVAHLDAGMRVALRTEDDRLDAATGARQRARLLAFLARVEVGERAA